MLFITAPSSLQTLRLSSIPYGLIFLILVILAGLAGVTYLVSSIKRGMRSLRSFLPSASDVSQLLDTLPNAQNRPTDTKSLQNMESLVLPAINRDFPELNIESMRNSVQSELTQFFSNELAAASSNSYRQRMLSAWWASFSAMRGLGADLDGRSVYRVVIKNYEKMATQCHIIWQAGFYYQGPQAATISDRVDVVFTYELKPQSEEAMAAGTHAGTVGVGMNCPNCGAPVEILGVKRCSYCQTPLNANWDMVWRMTSVQSR